MRYYHGSRSKDLKRLTLENSNDGYVWLAEQYEFAVLYAGNSLRFWDYNFDTDKLIIREIAENCFERLYKGVECYIYSAEDVGEYERSDRHGRRSIRCQHDVDLTLYEYIPDVYEKIMQLYREGKIELRFWHNYSPEEQEREKNSIIRKFAPTMQEEHDRFPDEYRLLTSLIPELKIENLHKET